jgi:hypothetical protein
MNGMGTISQNNGASPRLLGDYSREVGLCALIRKYLTTDAQPQVIPQQSMASRSSKSNEVPVRV